MSFRSHINLFPYSLPVWLALAACAPVLFFSLITFLALRIGWDRGFSMLRCGYFDQEVGVRCPFFAIFYIWGGLGYISMYVSRRDSTVPTLLTCDCSMQCVACTARYVVRIPPYLATKYMNANTCLSSARSEFNTSYLLPTGVFQGSIETPVMIVKA